jgi:F-type H+-transporting ATPase subunit epsilon
MPERFQFELVTPERLLLAQEADMVVVPGSEGDFGVLAGHAPLISTIRPGIIAIYEGRVITRRIFVVGGIAEVTPQRCTVLADEAFEPEALDRAAIEAALQVTTGNMASLRDQVGHASGPERERLLVELRGLERAEAVARAKLQAVAAETYAGSAARLRE